jgi:hypothetical protein
MSLEVRLHLNLNCVFLDEEVLFQDRLVFWGGLIVHPLVWGLFCVMNAITIAIFEVRHSHV